MIGLNLRSGLGWPVWICGLAGRPILDPTWRPIRVPAWRLICGHIMKVGLNLSLTRRLIWICGPVGRLVKSPGQRSDRICRNFSSLFFRFSRWGFFFFLPIFGSGRDPTISILFPFFFQFIFCSSFFLLFINCFLSPLPPPPLFSSFLLILLLSLFHFFWFFFLNRSKETCLTGLTEPMR